MKSISFQTIKAFLLLGTATAFTPKNSLTATRAASQSNVIIGTRKLATDSPINIRVPTTTTTALGYGADEESEWYSPPPPPPKKEPEEEQGPKLPRGVTPKVAVITSRIDLEEFLAEDDRLCVVKFHAAWCKSCQKFNLHFSKLAAQHADWIKGGHVVKKNSVRFAEVEWGANLDLCKALGVKKLPSTFFYSQGMKIDSLAAGPSRFFKVRDAVQRYASMTPTELQFEAKLEEGKKLMEEAARRERFEEVAKARELRRHGGTQSSSNKSEAAAEAEQM